MLIVSIYMWYKLWMALIILLQLFCVVIPTEDQLNGLPPVAGTTTPKATNPHQHHATNNRHHVRHQLSSSTNSKHSNTNNNKHRNNNNNNNRNNHHLHQKVQKTLHFLLFSTPDETFYKSSYRYQNTVETYAKRHNYSYYLHPSNFTYYQYQLRGSLIGPHYYRMYAALQLLTGKVALPPGRPAADWIVYLDADIMIAEPFLPLEAMLDSTALFRLRLLNEEDDCHFIAQDYPHIVNSGMFFLRNSTWSIDFIKNWIAECERAFKYPLRWVYDQGPLQNIILKVSNNSFDIVFSVIVLVVL